MQSILEAQGLASDRRFFSWKFVTVPCAGLLGVTTLALGVGLLLARPLPPLDLRTPTAALTSPLAQSGPYGALIVDLRAHGSASAPVVASLDPTSAAPETAPSAEEVLRPSLAPPPSAVAEAAELVDAPLPPHRPTDLKTTASLAPPTAPSARRVARLEPTTVVPAQPSDSRGFLERIFGFGQPNPQAQQPASARAPHGAVAYAATQDSGGFFSAARSIAPSPAPAPRGDGQTAVYDISAHTVYLPNGARLEAHSGLRERLDDPRFVHERMRGATPPAVYELTPREALFHGVQALRLTPVSGTTYGRSGLLAHTYMLGPNGDSNGCVSFRDYQAFLRAYRNGEIKRLAVVAHAN